MPTSTVHLRNRMRSAVVGGRGDVQLVRLAPPQPGPRQVRFEVQGCGACGSDLPVWEGRSWFQYPREPGAPGHEGWGRVDAVGDEVTEVAVGDRVAALGYRSYAELDVAEASHVIRLPDALDGEPFPGEALGCAFNVFRRARISAGDTVAVVGIGFLGAVVTALAAATGATVIAVSRRPTAHDLALRTGAAEAIGIDDEVPRRVEELTGGELCDVVVEAAGVQATLDLCGRLVRVRGRLVVAGYHQDGPRTVDMQLWNWRGLDVINAHERDPAIYVEGMRLAAEAVVEGRLDPTPLYTHRFELERLGEAFAAMRDRPGGFLKALVLP